MAVETSRWWFGRHVLISPAWVDQVSWAERKVFVNVTRQAVETSPQYDRSGPILREHEAQLHAHYGRSGYWTAPQRAACVAARASQAPRCLQRRRVTVVA